MVQDPMVGAASRVADTAQYDNGGRFSTSMSLAVLLALSVLGWAAIVGLALMIF